MGTWKTSPVYVKSVRLTRLTIEYTTWLKSVKREFTVSDQLKRSIHSIGANISEAQEAQSQKDLVHKLSIALKEARESEFHLECLTGTNLSQHKLFNEISELLNEVVALLVTSKNTAAGKK